MGSTFSIFYEAAEHQHLMLVDGGLCHWTQRKKDKVVVIYEIIILPEKQGQGIGTRILDELKKVKGATAIFAKCPSNLPANKWYKSKGFEEVGVEIVGNRGTQVTCWRLELGRPENAIF
jgi:ribosomal protein S18 acetylase RimI-like enzyme